MIVLQLILILPLAFLLYRISGVKRGKPSKVTKTLPGPKGYPLVGNLFDVPKAYPWLKFHEWGDQYGPIFKLEILGSTIVIISSEKIATDLLALRGAIYSDRPYSAMVYELISNRGNLTISPMGDYWRRGRKFAQSMLSSTAASQWEPLQVEQAASLASNLSENPSRYDYLFERYSTRVSLKQMYGKTISSGAEDEFHVKKIMTLMHTIERAGTFGAYLVDSLPLLLRLPDCIAPFKREGKALHKEESTYFAQLLEETTERHKEGICDNPPSFAQSYLENLKDWDLSHFEGSYVLGTLFGGGAGTTSAAMQSFCLAMCHFPQWQVRLQKEVDDVVGHSRPPSFMDMQSLPVVRAIAKEVLRWRPVVSGGVPHRAMEDDIYEGYFIPKGATIIPNQWAIHRDETMYPNPDIFNPDRWLNPKYPTFQAPLEQFPNLKRFSAFGFGRRICPGLETAERSLFIEIATIGWACEIGPKQSANGDHLLPPIYDYTPYANSAPKKFEFDVFARDGNKIQLLKKNSQTT